MNLKTLNPYRPSSPIGRSPSRSWKTSSLPEPATHRGIDGVILSAAATEPKRNVKKMGLWGAVGTVLGVAAAAVIPGAGLGALLVGALVGGVGGAAVADGALTDAGTRPAQPFDPYNPSHVLDPWNLNHPQNPFNPLHGSR